MVDGGRDKTGTPRSAKDICTYLGVESVSDAEKKENLQ